MPRKKLGGASAEAMLLRAARETGASPSSLGIRLTSTGFRVVRLRTKGAAALKGRRTERAKGLGLRWSPSRGEFYIPIAKRPKKAQRTATNYDVFTCASGATARGSSPTRTCGPRAKKPKGSTRSSRSHKNLALWRWGSISRIKINPSRVAAVAYDAKTGNPIGYASKEVFADYLGRVRSNPAIAGKRYGHSGKLYMLAK